MELTEPLQNRVAGQVRVAAQRWTNKVPGHFDDFVQCGWLGVVEAARIFDPDRGIKFVTIAFHYINGEMAHYARDFVRCGQRRRGQHRVPSSLDELTEQLGVDSKDELRVLGREDHGYDRTDVQVVLQDQLERFSPQVQRVLFMLACGYNQEEIALQFGVSKRHVCRMLKRNGFTNSELTAKRPRRRTFLSPARRPAPDPRPIGGRP